CRGMASKRSLVVREVKGLNTGDTEGHRGKGGAEYAGLMGTIGAGNFRIGRVTAALLLVGFLFLQHAGAQDQTQPDQTPQPGSATPAAGQAGQENPDTSGGTKKDTGSANPVQQIVDVTKNETTKGLLKARDWESSRIFGIYVGKNRKLVAMTEKQRKEIYLKQTLTTPEAYIKRMVGALFDQATGSPRQWQGGIGGFGERWASHEGQFIAANSIAALGNYGLGYEVRYDQCKCEGKWPRIRHAFIRNLVTYDRSEEHLRPQWALYGGAFAGGMIGSTWKPGNQNVWRDGAFGMVGQLGYGTLLNFLTEFRREINRKQGVQ
ncbi:MAG: hypothetical protein WCC95_07310, partial [Candidatus Sulfotelmatobacter sp.]